MFYDFSIEQESRADLTPRRPLRYVRYARLTPALGINKDGGKNTKRFLIVGLNRKPFFKGRFTQILIETDEFETSRHFPGPYEGCRKL